MILIDTNVLVALVDEGDGLRGLAMADLGKFKGPYEILDAVLVETYFLLNDSNLRRARSVHPRAAISTSRAGLGCVVEQYLRVPREVCASRAGPLRRRAGRSRYTREAIDLSEAVGSSTKLAEVTSRERPRVSDLQPATDAT